MSLLRLLHADLLLTANLFGITYYYNLSDEVSLMRQLLFVLCCVIQPAMLSAAEPQKTHPAARLIFQDATTSQLKWVDVVESDNGAISFSNVTEVAGFPKLDTTKQSLVQMRESQGRLVVGVRDNDEGKFGSGWIMVLVGTKYTEHGDHGHWNYKKPPQVIASTIDANQGNPAHVYLYDKQFYIANDLKAGYTRLDPETFSRTTGGEPIIGKGVFIPGGGNHITLATVNNQVGYSAWIDGGGPNKGRVDVTPITDKSAIKYQFHLPTGVIHGATACAGKVFFAPADGICWVEADLQLKQTAEQVSIKHISLGKDGDKPLRTGAFATHQQHVICVTGKDEHSKLVLLDASSKEPTAITVKLNGQQGHKPLTPNIVSKDGKKPIAFVFHDHAADEKIDDVCDVVSLDPNGDGKYDDAKVVKTLKVGPSQVTGHSGHHDIGFDADAKLAYITNPGNATITVIDLKTLETNATLKLTGKPTALVVVGGRDLED